MIRNISAVFLIVLGTGIMRVSAQHAYTLEQCRVKALENNVRIKNAGNEVKRAEEDKKEAFTNYFPTVSATGTGFMASKGLLEMELSPEMGMSLMKDGVLGGFTAVQPVFAGRQLVNADQLAGVGLEVSKIQQSQTENEVCLTVENYFWQVVTLKEKRHTVDAIRKMLERLCKDVEISVEAGITRRNDLLQVQLQQNEIESRSVHIENRLQVAYLFLAQYMGVRQDSFEVVSAIDEDETIRFPDYLYVNPHEALKNNNDYLLLNKNVESSEYQYKMTVGKYLPAVSAGGGYLYDNLMDEDRTFWMGFATLSIPVSDWWGGSHAIKNQKLQLINVRNEMNDKSELLVIQMQKSWNDLIDAYKQILIAQKSIEQSTENLRLNNDYYRAGTTTMSDLLDAQSLFQQSRDNYVDAYAQYQLRKQEYIQVTGR